MERSVVIAGFGGQGLLFAGQVLARAAVADGREAFWIPSYGPEMRGGTASCTVIVGDEPIGSPVIDRADAAIAMNFPSLEKYGPRVAPGGLLIINASLVTDSARRPDIEELQLPCTELAAQAGDDRLVSVVALGALVGKLRPVDPAAVVAALREIVGKKRPEALAADLAAFRAGMEFVGATAEEPAVVVPA